MDGFDVAPRRHRYHAIRDSQPDRGPGPLAHLHHKLRSLAGGGIREEKKPFHKIANVADLAVDARGRTEIIKFHGDFADDESLVLSEATTFSE